MNPYYTPKPSHTLYIHLIPQALKLLDSLPSSREEIQYRIGDSSLKSIRHCLIYLVCTQTLTQTQGDQLSPLFKVLGVDGIETRLLTLFQHTHRIEVKEQLLAMLFHSEVGLELFENLSDEERVELSGPWMRPMIRLASCQSFPRYALCALYTSTPQSYQPLLLEKMETFRALIGGCPSRVYEVLIKQGLSPLHSEDFLKHIHQNGALKSLDSLLDEAPNEVRLIYTQLLQKSQSKAG